MAWSTVAGSLVRKPSSCLTVVSPAVVDVAAGLGGVGVEEGCQLLLHARGHGACPSGPWAVGLPQYGGAA